MLHPPPSGARHGAAASVMASRLWGRGTRPARPDPERPSYRPHVMPYTLPGVTTGLDLDIGAKKNVCGARTPVWEVAREDGMPHFCSGWHGAIGPGHVFPPTWGVPWAAAPTVSVPHCHVMEHTGFDLHLVGEMIRVADLTGVTPIVRVPVYHAALYLTPQDLVQLGVSYTSVAPPPPTIVLNALRESAQRIREQVGQPVGA